MENSQIKMEHFFGNNLKKIDFIDLNTICHSLFDLSRNHELKLVHSFFSLSLLLSLTLTLTLHFKHEEA